MTDLTTSRGAPSSRPDVVILGASNVSFSLPTVVRAVQATFKNNVRLWCVHGLGRSYGQRSRAVGRELDGILESEFWEVFASRDRPGPVFALMTDLGNDLVYGVSVDQIEAWATECAARLRSEQAELTMTQLPAAKLLTLSRRRYHVSQRILFPGLESDYDAMRGMIRELDGRIPRIAAAAEAALTGPEQSWYGFDPIHLREYHRRAAWARYLGQWPSGPPPVTPLAGPLTRMRIHRLRRARKWVEGRVIESPQPSIAQDAFEFWQW